MSTSTKSAAPFVLSAATFAAYLVRSEDGSPDVSATEQKFSEDLTTYLLKLEEQDGAIAEVVSTIFDEHLGKRIPMPALLSLVVQRMNVDVNEFKTVSDKVGDYIRRNSGEKGSALFHVGKGKVGGVARWADEVQPANATDNKGRPLPQPAPVAPITRSSQG